MGRGWFPFALLGVGLVTAQPTTDLDHQHATDIQILKEELALVKADNARMKLEVGLPDDHESGASALHREDDLRLLFVGPQDGLQEASPVLLPTPQCGGAPTSLSPLDLPSAVGDPRYFYAGAEDVAALPPPPGTEAGAAAGDDDKLMCVKGKLLPSILIIGCMKVGSPSQLCPPEQNAV